MSEEPKNEQVSEAMQQLASGVAEWGKSVESLAARQAFREKMEVIELEMSVLRKREMELMIARLEREESYYHVERRRETAAAMMAELMAGWLNGDTSGKRKEWTVFAEAAVGATDTLLAELAKE